jgi:hypothetical protein
MKPGLVRCIAAGIGLSLAFSAIAHHSQSEFDQDMPVMVEGTVSKVEWKSPHARLYVEAVEAGGETVNWNFELPSPNTLMRRGWRRNALKPGDRVTVTGIRARNFSHIGIARTVTDEDGKAMFSGSTDPVY